MRAASIAIPQVYKWRGGNEAGFTQGVADTEILVTMPGSIIWGGMTVMPKLKTHKGLLKRVKITGGGKVKFRKAFNGHLRSHKTGAKIRDLRLKAVAKPGDMRRLRAMLHQPIRPAG